MMNSKSFSFEEEPEVPTRFVFNKIKLDVRPDRIDLRDLPYRPPLVSLPPRFPSDANIQEFLPHYTRLGLILDQGQEGACTGFGLAAVVNYLRFIREWELRGQAPEKLGRVSPHLLYELARLYDEWPGEDYEGSSCRGALKGWHKHGVCNEDLWPRKKQKQLEFSEWRDQWRVSARATTLGVYYRVNRKSVVDMQAAIREIGAVYVSATVHEGWDDLKPGKTTHDGLTRIRRVKSPKEDGGHAFALVGYNEFGFVVQNSWGPTWGSGGFALLPYEEWVQYGDDAWAVALGVPAQVDSPTSVVSGRSRPGLAMAGSSAAFLRSSSATSGRSDRWTSDEALDYTIVTGNDGFVIRRKVDFGDSASTVDYLARELPQASGLKKMVIYAHGGLNSESDSLKRIGCLGPYFLQNGIYPLFLTWKTGPVETLANILQDAVKPFGAPAGRSLQDRLADAWDRTVEVAAARGGVKSLWSEMKENATLAAESGRGLQLLARALGALKGIEIHAVGHSAGSIVLASLLRLLSRGPGISSCTLWAPAATVELANDSYRPALEKGRLGKLAVENMSDQRERDDNVSGVYRKSLLYLVSRALEVAHKKPLMGLAATYDAGLSASVYGDGFDRELAAWRTTCADFKVDVVARSEPAVSTGVRKISISHGGFDNDIRSVTAAIERILGGPVKKKVTQLEY